MDKPSGGTIELDGQDLAELSEADLAAFRRDHLGFIFQEYNLLETLTIRENMMLALTIKQTPKAEIKGIVEHWAAKLGISEILQHFPCEVSGGQRQRCACARAIATQPALILADEPTGALDSQAAKQLLETLTMLRGGRDDSDGDPRRFIRQLLRPHPVDARWSAAKGDRAGKFKQAGVFHPHSGRDGGGKKGGGE